MSSAVADMINDCHRVQIVTDAAALLQDGFPLDTETKVALTSIGVNYIEFTKRFEIQTEKEIFR